MNSSKRDLKESVSWFERAKKVIPSQTQTFSKGPNQFVQGVSPIFLARGKGSHVWDVDGHEYIDYISGLGPVILGHDYPAVSEAAIQQIRNGISFSLPHYLEVELAELLCEIIPCAEMVRFGKNGSDATAGAVRVARAYTGREKIACSGYHGWQDWFIGTTTRKIGIPKSTQNLTLPFNYNDIDSLKKIFEENSGEIAGVIMEPMGVLDPKPGFLESVKELAHKNGALLIFDEVVTGFRMSLGGAQELLGVTPDIACFGKAMANGFPIAAVVGRRDVMKFFDDVFFSFTNGGEAASLAAAIATIKEMKSKKVIPALWDLGRKIKDNLNSLIKEKDMTSIMECLGPAPRTIVAFKGDETDALIARSLFQQELVKRGVLFLTGHNLCFTHSPEDVEKTCQAQVDAVELVERAFKSGTPGNFIEGTRVEPIFRKP